MADEPTNVLYTTIWGRLTEFVIDGPDPDRNPDRIPIANAVIELIPDLPPDRPWVRNAAALELMAVRKITCTTNADGNLIGPDGLPSVRIVSSTNDALDPSNFTYRLTIQLPGSAVKNSFSFAAVPDNPSDPRPGMDISSIVPLPASPGQSLVAWLTAVADTEANRSATEAAAATAQGAADDAAASVAESGRVAVDAYVTQIGRYDVAKAINSGETLAKDKSANASVILQRAITNAGNIYDATGIPQQVWVPAGRYRIDSYLVPRTGVGFKGAGVAQTVFFPQGTVPFLRGGFQDTPIPTVPILVDNVFEDFTVNCYDQTDTAYNAAVKAFYMQNLLRPKFRRINCLGSWASQFGNDFMVDAEHVDCWSKDSGRGGPPDARGTGSGFAVGVGRYENESYTYVNCVTEGAKGSGYFFERLDTREARLFSPNVAITGGSVQDNAIGMNDCGTGGILANGVTIRRNGIGWLVRAGNSSTSGGRDGQIIGCRFYRNTGDGIQFAGNVQGGGYRILDTQFIENTGAGIRVASPATLSAGALTIRGNAFLRNVGGGCRIEGTGLPLKALSVEDNEFDGNTGVGLYLAASVVALMLCRNRFVDHFKTGVQLIGLSVLAALLTAPRIQQNLFLDQPTATSNLAGYDQAHIGDNIVIGTPTSFMVAADDFNRADGPLTTTATGNLPYVLQGAGAGVVVGNQAAMTGATTLTRTTVNFGSANGTFKMTLAAYAGAHEGGVVLRYKDASNELTIAARTTGTNFHYRLLKRIAGAQTQIAEFAVDSAAGDVFEIVLSGAIIIVRINGTERYNGSVPELTDGTSFGWFTTGTSAGNLRVDNISFEAAL